MRTRWEVFRSADEREAQPERKPEERELDSRYDDWQAAYQEDRRRGRDHLPRWGN